MATHLLETPRLLLQSVSPTLIREYFKTKSKAEILSFFGTDEKGYERLLHMYEKGMETHRISVFWFLLTDKESGRRLGDCGFHTWNATHRRAEIYYNLNQDEDKGKGLMSEALEAVIAFGFEQLDLHRIQGNVAAWNAPSVALLKKFGFSFEGTAREDYIDDGISTDSDVYSLLKPEWEARRSKI